MPRILSEKSIPTPFGSIQAPEVRTPTFRRPEINNRRREALKHAVAIDGTDIIAEIPYVGSNLADSLRRMHTEQLSKHLTKEESDKFFYKFDKVLPDAPALFASFVESEE